MLFTFPLNCTNSGHVGIVKWRGVHGPWLILWLWTLGYRLWKAYGRVVSFGTYEQGGPNVFNSALKACDVHPAAHSESSLTEVSSVGFSDFIGDEILFETFIGESFLRKHLKQRSEDGLWNWSSRPWERNEEIAQYNKDENKKAEFIERNKEVVKKLRLTRDNWTKKSSLTTFEGELPVLSKIFQNHFPVFPAVDWVICSCHTFMPNSKITFCTVKGLSCRTHRSLVANLRMRLSLNFLCF